MSTEYSEDGPRPADRPRPAPVVDDEFDEEPRSLVRFSNEDRLIGVFVHWSGVLCWFLAPLIFYLVQPNRRSLAAWHAREAFNFQLSVTVYYILPLPLFFLVFFDLSLLLVAIALLVILTFALGAFEIVVVICASIAAYRGRYFRCPLNIPFIPRPKLLPSDSGDYVDRE